MVNVMSDPVTNAEVEDVLSSIRRLVSEDKRPLQGSNPSPAPDRLVLTPALRVAEPVEAEAEQPSHDTGAEPEQHQAEGRAEDQVESAVAAGDDPAHDYSSDPYNFDDDQDEDGEGHLDLGAFVPAAHAQQSESPDDDVPEQDGTDDLSRMLSNNITSPALEDDQPDDSPQAHAEEAPMEVDAQEAPALSDNVEALQPQSKAAVLSAKIEELEAAIGNIADTWEPDGASGDAYAGTEAPAMVWEDDPEPVQKEGGKSAAHLFEDEPPIEDSKLSSFSRVANAFGKQETEAQPDPEKEQQSAEDSIDYALDEQLIDEEMLRDLVSEIVRAELQGALGERITRNVRKLVRREIHRALTAQDLE